MISSLAVAVLFQALLQSDTTILLGATERDLTGDAKPELLKLVGVGPTADSLGVTFSIEESGRVIYLARVALLSRKEYERSLRSILQMSYEAWLKDVGQSFFADIKFQRPSAFLESLGASVPGHIADIPSVIARDRGFPADSSRSIAIWQEIQRVGVTIFGYSPGGDAVTAIAWSPSDRRFYRLLECC